MSDPIQDAWASEYHGAKRTVYEAMTARGLTPDFVIKEIEAENKKLRADNQELRKKLHTAKDYALQLERIVREITKMEV